ncbi:response regulator transcription factor [Bacteroidota bacterium]
MAKTKVLIVEDDPFLGLIVKENFETRGYESHLCKDGESGLKAYCKLKPDICILDVMMPIKDGFTLAKEIRKIDKKVPLIFLTAKSLQQDVIEGFNIGADDYIKKPFSMEELLLRVSAIIKRADGTAPDSSGITTFYIGKYLFNYEAQFLRYNDSFTQKLTHREAELLKLLFENKNQVLDREPTLTKLWGDDNYFTGRSMDVFISKIRKYLQNDPNLEIINIRGKGYKLVISEEK